MSCRLLGATGLQGKLSLSLFCLLTRLDYKVSAKFQIDIGYFYSTALISAYLQGFKAENELTYK